MKLDTPDIRSMTSDDFETIAMGVDARTAQVFFRDRMYTEEGKLRVIAQEYSANARDAHRESGKSDTAIQISLPTTLDPQFVVRDFGMGISPDRMKNVFSIYGRSTKTKSDFENGGFGIGAKCGFSYASAFAVTTIHARTKYVYSLYIDDEAMNQIALMYSGPAGDDEPDGTEVKIPINTSDIPRFIKWVMEVTHYWTPRPVFVGREATYSDVTGVAESGVGWELRYARGMSYINDKSGIWVIADGVPYNVPHDDAMSCSEDIGKMSKALIDLNLAMVMPFKVGEIMLYPSREILYYNNTTKHSIVTRMSSVINDVVAKLQAKLDEAKTVSEAVALWWNSSHIVNLATKLCHPKYKGHSILSVRNVDELGIKLVEFKIDRRGSGYYVKEYNTVSQTTMKSLFQPAAFSGRGNRFLVDPTQPLTVKEVRAAARACGPGTGYIVEIADPALAAAAGVPVDEYVAAGFKILAKPPKPTRVYMPPEAVFMTTHSVRHSTSSSRNKGFYSDINRTRVLFHNINRHRFIKTRVAEQLDDTKITYVDCGEFGEKQYDDAMQMLVMARMLHTGFDDIDSRNGTITVSEWMPRLARHVDESSITFLPDYIEEVRLEAQNLDDAGILRLFAGGFYIEKFEPAKRWFWRRAMGCSTSEANRKKAAIVHALRMSKRFSQHFLDVARIYLDCEERDDDDDDYKMFISKNTQIAEAILGPITAARVLNKISELHAVRDEFQALFTAIPEAAYLFEAITHTGLGANQRDNAMPVDEFLAELIKSKYTASLQFSHINDDPKPEATTTPNQESTPTE